MYAHTRTQVKFLKFLQKGSMRAEKKICEQQGDEGDNFFSIIGRARDLGTDEEAEVWGENAK